VERGALAIGPKGTRLVDRSFTYRVAQRADFGRSHRDDSASLLALEVLMLRAGNFNLEWGYLAPAPSFLRTVRLVVVAAAIAATASAVVVFALMRQPAAEESIAARTLVQSVDQAPPTDRASVATETQTQAEHAADAGTSAASETDNASAHPRAPAAVALAEAPSMMADAPPAREASEISASPVREAAPSLKPPSKKPRLTPRDERPVAAASSARIALARYASRPAPPSTGNATHDGSVVGWTIGVTGDIVAATQRAISAVAVIPSWIGSIGRQGQSPRQPANSAAGREVRSCTKASTTRRSSASSSSPAYCDHINHMHAWNERYGYSRHGWREDHDNGRDG
jgi:hypothetical protein